MGGGSHEVRKLRESHKLSYFTLHLWFDVILHSMLNSPHNLHVPYYCQLAKSPTILIVMEDMFQNLSLFIKLYCFFFELLPLYFLWDTQKVIVLTISLLTLNIVYPCIIMV